MNKKYIHILIKKKTKTKNKQTKKNKKKKKKKQKKKKNKKKKKTLELCNSSQNGICLCTLRKKSRSSLSSIASKIGPTLKGKNFAPSNERYAYVMAKTNTLDINICFFFDIFQKVFFFCLALYTEEFANFCHDLMQNPLS